MNEELAMAIGLVILAGMIVLGLVWWLQNRPCAPDEHRQICYGIDAKGNQICEDITHNEYGPIERRYSSYCVKNCLVPTGVTNLSEFEAENTCVNGTWVRK